MLRNFSPFIPNVKNLNGTCYCLCYERYILPKGVEWLQIILDYRK
jgi:hypothetical protein